MLHRLLFMFIACAGGVVLSGYGTTSGPGGSPPLGRAEPAPLSVSGSLDLGLQLAATPRWGRATSTIPLQISRMTITVGLCCATSVAWASAGRHLAVDVGATLRVLRRNGAREAVVTASAGTVMSVAWALDGQALASGSADGTVRIWQANGQLLTTLFGLLRPIRGLAWAPTDQPPYGRMVAIGTSDEVTLEWLGGRIRTTLTGLVGVLGGTLRTCPCC